MAAGIFHKKMALREEDICYLAGAGEDIGFDLGMASLFPCHIHIFDPTPKSIAYYNNIKERITAEALPVRINGVDSGKISGNEFGRIAFHPWGLAGLDGEMKFYFPKNPEHVSCSVMNLQKTEKYFSAECCCISTIMRRLEHSKVDFLKMDIEGAEYQVMERMISDGIFPSFLAIEFDELHTPLDAGAENRVTAAVHLLKSSGYRYIFRRASNLTFIR